MNKANSFLRWVFRWLFITGLAAVIAFVSVLAGLKLAIILLVAAGVGVLLFNGGTTCKEVCAWDFVFRFGGFLALCLGLFILFCPLGESIHAERNQSIAVAKANPSMLLVYFNALSPPAKNVLLEPDEKHGVMEILKNGKPLGMMTFLWQKHVSATPQTAYSLTFVASTMCKPLHFDKEGRVLNARFSKKDEKKLADFIQNMATRGNP